MIEPTLLNFREESGSCLVIMSYDLIGDVVAIFIIYIASHSLASDRHLHESESNSFFPLCT